MMATLGLLLLGLLFGALLAVGCIWKLFAVLCSTEEGACETIATLLRAFASKLPAETAVVVDVKGEPVAVPLDLIAFSLEHGALQGGPGRAAPTDPTHLN
jgi:hypothetical protein